MLTEEKGGCLATRSQELAGRITVLTLDTQRAALHYSSVRVHSVVSRRLAAWLTGIYSSQKPHSQIKTPKS